MLSFIFCLLFWRQVCHGAWSFFFFSFFFFLKSYLFLLLVRVLNTGTFLNKYTPYFFPRSCPRYMHNKFCIDSLASAKRAFLLFRQQIPILKLCQLCLHFKPWHIKNLQWLKQIKWTTLLPLLWNLNLILNHYVQQTWRYLWPFFHLGNKVNKQNKDMYVNIWEYLVILWTMQQKATDHQIFTMSHGQLNT